MDERAAPDLRIDFLPFVEPYSRHAIFVEKMIARTPEGEFTEDITNPHNIPIFMMCFALELDPHSYIPNAVRFLFDGELWLPIGNLATGLIEDLNSMHGLNLSYDFSVRMAIGESAKCECCPNPVLVRDAVSLYHEKF